MGPKVTPPKSKKKLLGVGPLFLGGPLFFKIIIYFLFYLSYFLPRMGGRARLPPPLVCALGMRWLTGLDLEGRSQQLVSVRTYMVPARPAPARQVQQLSEYGMIYHT